MQAERKRRHLPDLGSGSLPARRQRRHPSASRVRPIGERRAASNPRFAIRQQRQQAGARRRRWRRDTARAAVVRDRHRQRRAAAARRLGQLQEPVLLEPQNPRHLLLEGAAPARRRPAVRPGRRRRGAHRGRKCQRVSDARRAFDRSCLVTARGVERDRAQRGGVDALGARCSRRCQDRQAPRSCRRRPPRSADRSGRAGNSVCWRRCRPAT